MRNTPKLSLIGAVILLAPGAVGQPGTKSVSELVRSLTSRDQPHGSGQTIGIVGCGITQEVVQQRAIARELGSRGSSAVPELDRVLGSLEKEGVDSAFFNDWFLFAYARAQGPAAVPVLMRMIRNPKLDSLYISLDRAIALSLGLTSYLSSGRGREQMVICRRQEPKDALDQFIVALQQGDRSELESSIGPKARMALDRLLEGSSWEAAYRELWHAPPGGQGAMGYLFDIRGRWSEPETLEEVRYDGDAPLTVAEVALDTQFKTGRGRDCARYLVGFNKVTELGLARYLVNNTNLSDLVRSINTCFVQ